MLCRWFLCFNTILPQFSNDTPQLKNYCLTYKVVKIYEQKWRCIHLQQNLCVKRAPVNATSGMISYKTVKFKSEDSLYKSI